MTCTCGYKRPEHAKFCPECGAAFVPRCASCGADLTPAAKFCAECGADARRLATPTPVSARKVVTILFADLAGSTALHERLDPESVNGFMENYYQAMRGAVEAHRGTVVKFLGDGVMAAFGVPRVAEDDALRAVRAGVAMQRAFDDLAHHASAAVAEIGLRVALNTGEVVVNADNTDVVGDPVNVAARLQQEAGNGDVVLGESTHRLVAARVTLEPLGSVTLKGRAEAVQAYRVESLERPVGTAAVAFVGRDAELGRITAVYDAAISGPAARLAVLLGSPGLGKSRMVEEFTHRLGDGATVLTAQCDAAGGATFAPLAEALRQLRSANRDQVSLLTKEGESLRVAIDTVLSAADLSADTSAGGLRSAEGLPKAERDRITNGISALLAGSPASPEETFFVVRRFLAALAQQKPVILVIDDLQWAEPLLLDLVEHLVQWGSGVPLLVLVSARPELRDVRSSLVTPGGLVADVLTLSGLDAGAAMRLAANVIGAADLPAAVAAKVLATSEGNPLFVGELVRMLVQEGALTKEGDRWITGVALAALEMPPTIHALLAARIERLRPEERSVLERAAVVGRHFSRSAVAELLPRDVVDLDARLEALRRSELIERDSGWFLGEPVLRFHHILIRDAAYRRLLKGTRAELHARFADWVTARAADAADHDETIGWHLEQAHQLLRELGPLDAAGRVLGERAARHLSAAGRRALARDDLPVAADLLGRAIDRLDVDDSARADLALDWCEALLAAGDVATAAKAIEELARFLPDPSDLTTDNLTTNNLSARFRAWHTCFTCQLTVLTAPQKLQAAADAVAGAAEELAKLGDAAGEAKAHSVHAQALARLGRVGACEAALDQALAAARRAGDRRRANAVLAGAPLAALWGPSPVTRASGRCLDVVRVLRITQGAPAVESVALSCQGLLEALRGRTEAARRMLASSRKMVEDLGIAHRLFEADAFAGRIAAMEGDSATAERLLRDAYEGLRDLGLGIDAARASALLARTLLAQDRIAEAEALSHESERLAGDDLQAAIAWRGVRAEALAKRGEHAAAVDLAKAAVAIASATDALLDHADARMALAAALRAAGRGAEADAEERRAIELWEAKGATLLAERARRDGGRAAPGSVPVAEPIPAPRAVRRRVRPNAATAMQDRFDAALAARDFDGVAAVFDASHQEIDHPTGSTYGRDACIASLQRLFRSRQPHYEVERLATLGELLLLVRRRSSASGAASGNYDVGAYENEAIQLFEVNEAGLCCRAEVCAADRLGDAVARLYERYAELLPEGPGRARAASFARSIAAMALQPDATRRAAVFAPDVEMVDHRTIGTWCASGAEAVAEHFGSIDQVAEEARLRDHDVRAATDDALLVVRAHTGVDRQSGGAYERRFLLLIAGGADGRLARIEWFEEDREAEALERFEEISVGVEPRGAARRPVRPNAATRQLKRQWAAIEARDVDALLALGAGVEVIHHPTGATYGATEVVAMLRGLWRGTNLKQEQEILATLGDSLALMRRTASHDGIDAKFGSVGPVEVEFVVVVEVDASNRPKHSEVFAADHLGEAIARLYERYAELLPEGPERIRAAATARSVAVWNGSIDPDRVAATMAPPIECVDHRSLHLWSARGADEFLGQWRGQLDLATGSVRHDDVLALEPDALLVRQTYFGNERTTGGFFDHPLLVLFAFGADGLLTRAELWEPACETEALARFEELSETSERLASPLLTKEGARGRLLARHFEASSDPSLVRRGPPTEPFANTASRSDAELFRCFNGRDWEGVLACVAPVMVFDERRRLVRNTCDRNVWLEQFRFLFDVPKSRFTSRLRATRGERLALNFHRFEGEVAEGGGPLAMEDHFALHEVDAGGRIVGLVLFDLEDEEAAYSELDRRFEVGEACANPRLTGALATNRLMQARDWRAYAARLAPGFVYSDHRRLGWGDAGLDSETLIRIQQSAFDLSPDARYRADHVRLSARGILRQATLLGTRDGGAFETPMFIVAEVDEQGRVARNDTYDIEDRAGALARFAELAAPAAYSQSRFANAATGTADSVIACMVAHDWQRFEQLFAQNFRMSDRRRVVQLELDRDQYVAFTREVANGRTLRGDSQVLATRGDRLALNRSTFVFMDTDVGPSEIAFLILTEVDARGRIVAYVRWDLDDLDAACAELDARWQAGEAAAHPRASKWLADYLRFFAARDWNAMSTLFVPELVGENHRLVGWGTLYGSAAVVSTLQAQIELAPDTQERVDHVRTCADAVLFEYAWHGTHAGGAFENLWLVLIELDADGRGRCADVWEVEQLDQALARFAELAGREAEPAPDPFENAASQAERRLMSSFDRRDWAGVEACAAADLVFDDRQPLRRLTADKREWRTMLRFLFDVPARRFETRLLATRGERLSLHANCFEGEVADGGGPLALDDHLALYEVDGDGRIVAVVLFAEGDEDAAHAELDARFEARVGAAHLVAWQRHYRRAIEARDWETFAAATAPDFAFRDHRLLGWGTTVRDVATFVRVMQSVFDLAPDARYREDHVRIAERGHLGQQTLLGTRDGGAFEIPFLRVGEFDERGRIRRFDTYDLEDLDRARVRFAELAAPAAPTGGFENTASRAWREVIAVWRLRDVERFAALHPTALRYRDHRRLVQLDLDRDGFLAFTRPLLEMRSNSASLDILATRGERLALMRSTLEMADDSVGPSAIDSLLLIETDEGGAITAYDRYEVDDEDAARAEIQARWEAGEGLQCPTVAWMRDHSALVERRDWDALAALYSPAVVGHDHRLVGWGTLRGRTDFLQSLRSMEALSPDARMRGDHTRACARGLISSNMWVGTRDGGAFESPFLVVSETDPAGKVVRIDFYDPHHFDRARARFEEIAAEPNRPAPFPAREGVGRDPLAALAKPSAATVFLERAWAAFDLVDLEAAKEALATAREHFSPDFVWEDRRRIVGLSGGLDLMLASARERLASGARHQRRTIVGTAGDRVAIGRILWAGGPPDGRFEVEFLAVHEVNEAGLCTALIFFDPDDMRAAQREAWARWAAIDPVAAPWVELLTEITDAWNSHDRPRLRARYADDVVIEDHRHAGIGRIEGADAYLDSNVALWELAPDQRLEFGWSWPAVDRHGFVVTIRREGTVPDGGPFESEYLLLGLARNGRSTRAEFFEIDALDTALARFEELRPPSLFELRRTSPGLVLRSPAKEDTLRIPPNAATRARAQWARAVGARDWEGVRGLVRADFVFEDRGKRALVTGDVETWIASAEFTTSLPGVRIETPVIGTFGERISIDQIFWSGAPEGGAFEFERIRVLEIDEEGLFRRAILFDPDDRRAAFDEAHGRFVAAEGAAGGQAPIAALFRAAGLGDWETVRASLAADLAHHDHRNLGLGTLGRDAWVESLRALSDLADEMHVEAFCTLAWNRHGHVARTRQFGTVAGGGPFENVFIVVWLTDGDRISIVEVFDVDDAEGAVARFDELCAAAAAEETA